MDVKPPSYDQDVPVYTPTQPVVIPATYPVAQPVVQQDPNTGRDLFNFAHIGRKSELISHLTSEHLVMFLNVVFCTLIVVFLSDCLSP